MTTIERIDRIALNTLEGFLLSLGITPSEDSPIIQDYGPHRVYTVQGETEHGAKKLDIDYVFEKLQEYIEHRNGYLRAPRFEAHDVWGYGCPEPDCGYMMLFISISHTA